MANAINNVIATTIEATINDALITYFDSLETVRRAEVKRVTTINAWDEEHDTKAILSKARSKNAKAEDYHNAEVVTVNREVIVAGARETFTAECKDARKAMRDAETAIFGKKGAKSGNRFNAFTDFYNAYVAFRGVYDTNFAGKEARECVRACKVMLSTCFGVHFQSAKLSEKCARRIINSIGVRVSNMAELRKAGAGNCGVSCFNDKQVKTLVIRVFGDILALDKAEEFESLSITEAL